MIISFDYEKMYDETMDRYRKMGPVRVLEEYEAVQDVLLLDSVNELPCVDYLMDLEKVMNDYFVEVLRTIIGGIKNAGT